MNFGVPDATSTKFISTKFSTAREMDSVDSGALRVWYRMRSGAVCALSSGVYGQGNVRAIR